MTKENDIQPRFLTVKEFCSYMNIGDTKAREFIRGNNKIALNLGGKLLVDKTKLDKWIENNLI